MTKKDANLGGHELLKIPDFLAIGGSFGVLVQWAALPVFYFLIMSPQLGYPGDRAHFGADLAEAVSAPLKIGSVAVGPAFVWMGLLTIAATAFYLWIMGNNSLDFYARLSPFVVVIDVLAAQAIFAGEAVSQLEAYFIFPAIVVLFFVLEALRPDRARKSGRTRRPEEADHCDQGGAPPRVRLIVGVCVLAIVTRAAGDIVTRTAFDDFDPDRRLMLALPFRAAYFSLFLVYAVAWHVARRRRPPEDRSAIARRGVVLAGVTSLLFAAEFTLKVSATATSLAVGPAASIAAAALVLPIVGACYGVDGVGRTALVRLRSVLIRDSRASLSRISYVLSYTALLIVLTVWAIASVTR